MKKTFIIYALLTVGFPITCFAQSFSLDFLFSPGFTLNSEYLVSSAINDSTNFQLSKHNFQYSQPLKTKLAVKGLDLKNFSLKEVSLKKMDVKSSQFFLNYNFRIIQPTVSNDKRYENLYRAGFGFTALTASLKNGLWIYSANVYATENSSTLSTSFNPNFRGYLANIRTKDLKTFYLLGGGLLVHQGRFVPFPILGYRTKLAAKLRIEIVLPVHLKLNYRLNKKVNFDAVAHFSGISTIYRQGSIFNDNISVQNFRQLKTYLALNAKFFKHYRLKLEVGYATWQHIDVWSNATTSSKTVGAAPYVGLSINYNFGKSVFGNFMNQSE